MFLKRLTCLVIWILIPDYVFLQTVSRNNIYDEHVPCEYGWYNFKEKCFRVSGARENLDWNKAVEHCQVLGANLATVESLEENDFLVGLLLLEIQGSAWIGLHDQVNESDYHWQSGSQSGFRNWRPSEPSGNKLEHEDCVQLLVDLFQDSVGQWNDNDCKHSIGYICEKKSNPDKSSPNLKNCSSADGGGFRFKDSCYHLVNELKSWNDAEKYCIDKYQGHLMTILDKTTDYYLKYVLQGNNAELWTGIKIRNQFQQQWASGWYVSYNGFKEDPDFVDGTCVVRKHRKDWDIVSCSSKYAFICEKSRVKPPVLKPPPKDAFCPNIPKGWRDLGGEFCYYIETSKPSTWYEANFDCIRRDGQLVSLHSKEESDILSPFIQFSYRGTYIGLIRHYKAKDAFKWIDGSELNFTNWFPGEPNSGTEICAEVRSFDMKWNDIDCSNNRSYICSMKKISPNTTIPVSGSVTPSSNTAQPFQDHFVGSTTQTSTTAVNSDEKVKVSGHHSRNVIIGVVVCIIVLIILIIIAIFKFQFFNKKSMDTQLHYKDMALSEQDC